MNRKLISKPIGSGIYAYLYSSGQLIEKGAGFDLFGKYKQPATYYVDINDSGIEIRSDYLERIN